MKKSLPFIILILFSQIFLIAEEIKLPHIFTFIESPVVEQRRIFTANEIEDMHVTDFPSLMVAAGIQILSYGPYGLEQKPSIRGFTDETVRVIIDGICVNNAQYGTFDFSTVNIDDIEKIEIVKGGFTEGVSDEGAVGGAIYITTKKQSLGHHFNFNSELKSFFNANAPVDAFIQSVGYNGQLSSNDFIKSNLKFAVAQNKFLFNNYKGILLERENAEVIDGNGSVNFLHFFGEGNYFSLSNLFYGGKKNIPGPAMSKSFGLQQDYDNNFSVQLILPAVANSIRFENTFSWLSNTRFYDDAISDSAHFVNSFKYFANATFWGLKFFDDVMGFTFDYTNLDSTDDGKHNQFSGTLKNTLKFENDYFSASIPLAFKFSNENLEFVPKLGIGVRSFWFDIFMDAYRMVQFPNLDDLYWNDGINFGNPDLKPENGWGADLILNTHNILLPFSVCIFTNYYENKIQWANNGNGWTAMNVASAFYFGVDLNFEKKLLNNRFVVKGNGEYLYTRLLNKNSSTFGKKIMWTPDFTGSLILVFVLPEIGKKSTKKFIAGTKFSVEANYVGKRYCSNLNISFMEPYVLINFVAENDFYSGKWKWSPYFRIDNLLNESYESVENYPMPGISLSVGCKISC